MISASLARFFFSSVAALDISKKYWDYWDNSGHFPIVFSQKTKHRRGVANVTKSEILVFLLIMTDADEILWKYSIIDVPVCLFSAQVQLPYVTEQLVLITKPHRKKLLNLMMQYKSSFTIFFKTYIRINLAVGIYSLNTLQTLYGSLLMHVYSGMISLLLPWWSSAAVILHLSWIRTPLAFGKLSIPDVESFWPTFLQFPSPPSLKCSQARFDT